MIDQSAKHGTVASVVVSGALCRAMYPKIAQVGSRLTDILHNRQQHEALDMSDVCMCETIDALGLAGFDKAFDTIEAISSGQKADLLHVRHVPFCAIY